MTKVSYLQIPAGMEDDYWAVLRPGDRFAFSRVCVKDLFQSRSRMKGISVKSQLVALAPVWAALSSAEKAAWEAAGLESNLHGWKMFVADTTARRRAGISGYATPNTIYQSMVGRIEVVAPATGLQIEQAHPSVYYVLKKVTGTKAQYSPKAIVEPISLPITIGISWKTDLVAVSGGGGGASYGGCEYGGTEYGAVAGGARVRFYIVVISSYQGTDIETTLEIPFGLTDDWQHATATLSTVLGPVRGYAAFIEVYNARGDLYFDNVEIMHSAENWARDPICNNIGQSFTKAYIQVAKHWLATNISDGADFGSVYFIP